MDLQLHCLTSTKYNPYKIDKLLKHLIQWSHALRVIPTMLVHVDHKTNRKQEIDSINSYFLYKYTLHRIMKSGNDNLLTSDKELKKRED